MKIRTLSCALIGCLTLGSLLAEVSMPLASTDLVFAEKEGVVSIEAEHYFHQDQSEIRAWHLTTRDQVPQFEFDGDASHIAGASGGAYLEILPDNRRDHGEKLIVGENFSPEPGKMAILSYKVHFDTPGKYWLWARNYSTGTEDNGLHFGINGTWPESAQRWQTVVKKKWHWKSAQRTQKKHSGVDGILTLDVPSAGEHVIQVSMREDGCSLDKIVLANRKEFVPQGLGPKSEVKTGALPKAFPFVATEGVADLKAIESVTFSAASFDFAESGFYLDQGKWGAVNPEDRKEARVSTASPFPTGKYNLTIQAVGEEDGESTYQVFVNGTEVGRHQCPLSEKAFEEGAKYHGAFKGVEISLGDVIEVAAQVASADGKEYARARWSGLSFAPADQKTKTAFAAYQNPAQEAASKEPAKPALQLPRQPDGDGSVIVSGELKQWHKVTLTLDGPYAHELDHAPNPFLDYQLSVTFKNEAGEEFLVPGYFAADGNAGETSSESGTKWRVHFSPNRQGAWRYQIAFQSASQVVLGNVDGVKPVMGFDGKAGVFHVSASDKSGRDFRSRGRLSYVGERYLKFEGDQSYFLKAGADAPETLLAYVDFDQTSALNAKKGPLKSFESHVPDWNEGDPTWKGGKGKGMIGALNYLAGKGVNSFSFLPYNVDGDGSNVWPFVAPREKFHYDCSKLDQWGKVFDHATVKGLYLHFKLQETEIDDNRRGKKASGAFVRSSLDGGKLGPERKLYCRELIARFGHALALNWNIGEECTQTTEEIKEMASYIRELDPYDHLVVLHTYPKQQNKQYRPLLGFKAMTGLSLQNEWDEVNHLTAKWISESKKTGHQWVCANDEQGPAGVGVPPDPDYPGKTKAGHTIHDIRKYTLWGNLMAGGAGVEYYFGYKVAENDLRAEDFRSRDQSWDYCRIALDFFAENEIPISQMVSSNHLVGNEKNDNSRYCFAQEGALYLVFLPEGGEAPIQVVEKDYELSWFNPRTGEMGEAVAFNGKSLAAPNQGDWLAILRAK